MIHRVHEHVRKQCYQIQLAGLKYPRNESKDLNLRNISGTEFEPQPLCKHPQHTMITIKGSGLQSCFVFKNSRFRFLSNRINIIGDQFSGFFQSLRTNDGAGS